MPRESNKPLLGRETYYWLEHHVRSVICVKASHLPRPVVDIRAQLGDNLATLRSLGHPPLQHRRVCFRRHCEQRGTPGRRVGVAMPAMSVAHSFTGVVYRSIYIFLYMWPRWSRGPSRSQASCHNSSDSRKFVSTQGGESGTCQAPHHVHPPTDPVRGVTLWLAHPSGWKLPRSDHAKHTSAPPVTNTTPTVCG